MREVKAIIRPQRLEQVMQALQTIPDLPGVTVSRVHAYAGSRDGSQRTGEALETDFTKLEIIVPATLVDGVVAAIGRAGHTGRAGDGIVFVVPVETFARIREIGTVDSSS